MSDMQLVACYMRLGSVRLVAAECGLEAGHVSRKLRGIGERLNINIVARPGRPRSATKQVDSAFLETF